MFKQRCAPGWMPAQCECRPAVVHRVAPLEALRARSTGLRESNNWIQ
jgi:hypothetical protein